MSRLPWVLALLVPLLHAASPKAGAATAASSNCVEHGSGVRICSQLDETALRVRGGSTIWRVWLEGPAAPIQVRLHNSSPQVVRVNRGDDQIVHMGCRIHREVRRRVTAIGEGGSQLQARAYSPSVRQEAALIAAALAPRLAQIESEFVRRRGALPAGDSAEAVTELLDRTERELLDALNYQELAALRDYVTAQFRRARAPADRQPADHASLASSRRLVYVSLNALSDAAAAESTGDWRFDLALLCIRHLRKMAESDDLTTGLCLTSEPTAATFRMRPQSFNQWQSDKITTGEYREVYRGLYIYTTHKGFKTIRCLDPERTECPVINLVDDPDPTFRCDFQQGVCERRSDPTLPEGCHGRGH
ncbi:MAG TPA: hypothetical protein VGS57_08585 [Thermoanaerobaculia bacterium]|jgi:hypothetical protein|nr:hypothetical protein [Thermoanaerobaculia bacterium]